MGVAFVLWHFKDHFLKVHLGAASSVNSPGSPADQSGIRGYYLMKEESSPRFALKFLDEQQVQIYGDGKIWGPMCTYKISGTDLELKHACGVWHMEIRGDVLYQENYGWHFQLTNDNPNGSGSNGSAQVY